MFSAKLIELSMMDKVVQEVCQTVTIPWVQAPQSHRQQVPTRWKYDLEVTFTHCICQHHTSQPLNCEFEFGEFVSPL